MGSAAKEVEQGPVASLDGMHMKKVPARNGSYYAPSQQGAMARLFEERGH